MRLKKIMIDIIVISLALLLFIVWYQNYMNNSTQTTTFPESKNIEVYLITTDKGFQYWGIMNQGAADMSALMGVNYVWEAPAQRSTAEQIELINKAVEQGADALLVAADEPAAISSAIKDAKEKGVKIIYVDSPAYEESITTLSTDDYQAGVKAAQTMITILEDKGKLSGSVGIINLAAKANTKLREDGFRKTLEEDGRFNILDTVYIERDEIEESQNAAERMMEEHEDLVALFGASERTSIGVGSAIKASGNQYVGVGFDKTEMMMRLLSDRNLNAIIAQNPYTMGYLGVAEAVAAVNGEDTGPEYINTGVSVLTNY
ncbi:MAG: periplasmic binding protein/LacI transcriptional regulator [Herbinix sp.]|jgi:ribose transport system substrate-binding protein|nr:periplasmic binding protein/LacI transcriptional regulator [Herbinix sp.]